MTDADVDIALVGPELDTGIEIRLVRPPQESDEPEESKAATAESNTALIPWAYEVHAVIELYYASPWLGGIGNVLGDAVSSGDVKLVQRGQDLAGDIVDKDSPAVKEEHRILSAWLDRENVGGEAISEYSLSGLLRAMCLSHDCTGNIFVELVRDQAGDNLLRIINMLPQFVQFSIEHDNHSQQTRTKLMSTDPYAGQYKFIKFCERPKGDKIQREYIHYRRPNLISSFYGVPAWIQARDSVAADNAHRKYVQTFFGRHAAPRWLIHVTQDPEWQGIQVTAADRKNLFARIRQYLEANAGEFAGRSLVIQYPGGIKVMVDALDQKIEDPTFPNVSKGMRDEILATQHTSMIDLGLPEGSNRATSDVQAENFRDNVLAPFAEPAIAIINNIIHAPPPYGLGIQYHNFDLEFLNIADILARVQSVTTATGVAVMSPDEGRAIINLPPLPNDQGKHVYIDAAKMPMLMEGFGDPTREASS